MKPAAPVTNIFIFLKQMPYKFHLIIAPDNYFNYFLKWNPKHLMQNQ